MDKYVARFPAAAERRIGRETYIVALRESQIFYLNEQATAIWEAADGRTSLRSIVRDRICADFDVDAETALQDAEALVEQLVANGILTVSPVPVGPVAIASR